MGGAGSMIVLSLTEEDRDLLLLLSPAHRDSVLLALLTGKEEFSGLPAEAVYLQIKKRELLEALELYYKTFVLGEDMSGE